MKIFIIITLLVIIIAAGILAYMAFFKNKGNDIISNIEDNNGIIEEVINKRGIKNIKHVIYDCDDAAAH